MSIDIIIPTYNEYQNLKILLPYLKKHTVSTQSKIIVVDACASSDDTATLCNDLDVKYIKSKHTRRSCQMNDGAAASDHDCLYFLHADTKPPAQFLDQIIQANMNGYSSGCFAYKFDSERIMLKINSFFTQFKGIFTGGGDQSLFIARSTFMKLGGFCPKHNIMEDFEFYARLKRHKIPYKIIPERAIVSARKYNNNSWFKVNLINLIALISYKINPDPRRLSLLYKRWIN